MAKIDKIGQDHGQLEDNEIGQPDPAHEYKSRRIKKGDRAQQQQWQTNQQRQAQIKLETGIERLQYCRCLYIGGGIAKDEKENDTEYNKNSEINRSNVKQKAKPGWKAA